MIVAFVKTNLLTYSKRDRGIYFSQRRDLDECEFCDKFFSKDTRLSWRKETIELMTQKWDKRISTFTPKI